MQRRMNRRDAIWVVESGWPKEPCLAPPIPCSVVYVSVAYTQPWAMQKRWGYVSLFYCALDGEHMLSCIKRNGWPDRDTGWSVELDGSIEWRLVGGTAMWPLVKNLTVLSRFEPCSYYIFKLIGFIVIFYTLFFVGCFFCYLFDVVRYLLRKVDVDWLEHRIFELNLSLSGSMKVEADKSVIRVIYVWSGFTNCGTAIRRPPIGMKYEVGEFDSELWKRSWCGQTKYSVAYEVYEVLLSMKWWSDTECEEIIITLDGWCRVLSSQCTQKSTWSGSRKVTTSYGRQVETFANGSITFGKIHYPISWQSYECTGWMVLCSLQPVYVKVREAWKWKLTNQ